MSLIINSKPEVETVFDKYPTEVKPKIEELQRLIIETAKEVEQVEWLEETLKWGEPSYVTKIGSTLRIDWKPKNPDQYAMYFQCTSKLVPSFREKFGGLFNYEGTRAIVFQLNEEPPFHELKQCIKAALTYHKVKHLEGLGM
ncbi:DUF1801 domain-containing protein [Roseivirga spongicola]|uniref:DUF1801 domain-containing protein n=1 Tax=Roseivirga spongicola TaxID=333140 RepID=UPI002AC8B32B|nr:DUF1801 domain-containing protein [Roseivirga spongicola]WPZ08909.1 DUF1801 domain-containing protein [Roseivirga spongicola]